MAACRVTRGASQGPTGITSLPTRPSEREGSRQTLISVGYELVVKLGSSLVADDRGAVRTDVLERICEEVAQLHRMGESVIVVTSGAIARGMGVMELPIRPRAVDELQAASAVGQGKLYQVYDELLRARGVGTAQVLLTFFDMSARTHYLNARQTLRKLLEWRVVPVINENDTTTTDEISFGNNDFLAAQVAILLGAELLLLLTDAEGVFTADPRANPDARWFRACGGSTSSTGSTSATPPRRSARGDALEGGRGRDGHGGRDPDRDRERPAPGTIHADRCRRGRRDAVPRPARPATRASSCGSSTPSRCAGGWSSTRARRGRCGGRHQPAAGRRDRRGRGLRCRRRGRGRPRRRAESARGSRNYSAEELRQVRGLKSADVRELIRARARRRSTGLLRARVTLARWRRRRHR